MADPSVKPTKKSLAHGFFVSNLMEIKSLLIEIDIRTQCGQMGSIDPDLSKAKTR